MKFLDYLPKSLRNLNTIATVLIAVIAFVAFFPGRDYLRRPKIQIACGAIDLRVPAKFKMELMTWKMMSATDEIKQKFAKRLPELLREYGLSEEKVSLLEKDYADDSKILSDDKIKLEPHEEGIVKTVLIKLISEMPAVLMESMNMPDGVLFFEITNSGRTGAKKAHIVVRLEGRIYNAVIESDNKILERSESGSQLVLDLQAISPNSKTKGIVWYTDVSDTESLQENLISVSYEDGTVHQTFAEDDFYLAKGQ